MTKAPSGLRPKDKFLFQFLVQNWQKLYFNHGTEHRKRGPIPDAFLVFKNATLELTQCESFIAFNKQNTAKT